ncbi:MAG: hypothetical protein ABIH25_02710 [Candidatus Woesearchaeota archaeon]
MNKIGELSKTIWIIASISLGIVALLFVLFLLNTVYGLIFGGGGVDDETKETFEGLSIALEKLEGSGDILFKFSKSYSMIIFDKSNSASGDIGYYTRPSSCFNTACIVLCKDKSNQDSCLESKYIIYNNIDSFGTSSDKGIVYPAEIGKSKDELKLLEFVKSDNTIELNVAN